MDENKWSHLSDRALLCRPTVHDLVVLVHVVWVDPNVALDAKDALRVGSGIYHLPLLGRAGGNTAAVVGARWRCCWKGGEVWSLTQYCSVGLFTIKDRCKK